MSPSARTYDIIKISLAGHQFIDVVPACPASALSLIDISRGPSHNHSNLYRSSLPFAFCYFKHWFHHAKMPPPYTSSQRSAIAQFVGFTQSKESVAAKVSWIRYFLPQNCHTLCPAMDTAKRAWSFTLVVAQASG